MKAFRGILTEFCEDTSCHSLDRVGDGERKIWARIIWFLIFLACMIFLFYQLGHIYARYKRYEVVVDTTLNFEELPFPAITVCNLNLVPKSIVPQGSDLDQFLTLYNQLITSDLSNVSARTQLCNAQSVDIKALCTQMIASTLGSGNSSAATGRKKRSISSPSKPVLRWQSSVQLALPILIAQQNQMSSLVEDAGGMLLDCILNQEDCAPLSNASYSNEYGMCITVRPWQNYKAQSSGPMGGMSLLMDISVQDYLDITDVVGVRVFIHGSNASFELDSNGFYASVGTRTAFAVRMVNSTRLDTPYGDCYNPASGDSSGIKDLFYFPGDYTLTGCMKTCLQKTIIKQCGCLLLGYGIPSGLSLTYCWKDSLTCAIAAHAQASSNNQMTTQSCGCQPPCNTVDYTMVVSSAMWPSPLSVDSTQCFSNNNLCLTNPIAYYNNNTLQLEIYYDSLNYNQYTERPDYSVNDMFSDLGGNLGLFLGASVCTCMEVLSLIITCLLFCCRVVNKNFEKKNEIKENRDLRDPKKENHQLS